MTPLQLLYERACRDLPTFTATSHSTQTSTSHSTPTSLYSSTFPSSSSSSSSSSSFPSSPSSPSLSHVTSSLMLHPNAHHPCTTSTSTSTSISPSTSPSLSFPHQPQPPVGYDYHTRTPIESYHWIAHMDDIEMLGDMSPGKAMIAGACAGVSEHLVMFPVDTVKTRMQAVHKSGEPVYRNVFSALASIIRDEGVLRLYRGAPATVLGAIPSHAAYFATYEHFRRVFGGDQPGHHPVKNGCAGALATMAHDAVITPLDVVKQRLQVYNSSYSGVMDCFAKIYAQEGFRAFYASYPTTVLMNVPFMAVHFAAYETFKLILTGGEGDTDEHDPVTDIIAGGLAGACGGLVSTPFDVVKTRIQTQTLAPGQHALGAREIIADIMRTEGPRGFMTGVTARMLYFIPSAAIVWTTYGTMKRVLKSI